MAASKSKQRKKKSSSVQKTRLEKAGFEKADISAGELRKALRKGQVYADKHDWQNALPHLLKAWDAMPEDLPLLTLLSHGLAQLGVRDKAIMVLERTLAVHGETPEILGVMFTLANEMQMSEVAAKIALILTNKEPNVARHYVNLATAYASLERYDEAIEMLQGVLPLFPEDSDLWNVLATTVRARDGHEASCVFFEEAIRLGPENFKALSNYGNTLMVMGHYEQALEMNLRAIAANPKTPEPRLGAAQLLFYKGEMEEAWEHYEFRLDPRRSIKQVQLYTHKFPRWNGESLDDKTLFVTSEQGIGDEFMWGSYLPFLYEQAKKLVIGVDHRLVGIFRRRFPNAHVERYVDTFNQGYRYRHFPIAQKLAEEGELCIDFAVPAASVAKHAWRTVDDVRPHPEGFLFPDPDRAQEMKARLNAISAKPKVGLAWRSGLMTVHRRRTYCTMEDLGQLLKLSDQVDFINLQYGDVSDELKKAQDLFGVKIHNFDDIDLKQDIEANLAIMDNCDLMVSSSSAPGQFAMSIGTPTLLMSGPKLWWDFGGTEKVRFAKDGTLFYGDEVLDWEDIVGRITAAVRDRLSLD